MDPKFDGGMGGRDYYDENNGYTYTWDVTHDFNGLITLMGGTARAEANLDQLFREPGEASRFHVNGRSVLHGQRTKPGDSVYIQPSRNALEDPEAHPNVARIVFTDTLQGIPGDEDGGGLSAFVVFSMMGFYPVTPGIPTYDVGSPVFDKVTIHLKNGKDFSIIARNNSHDNKYVQDIRLNGQTINRVWFRHADIANGGTLELTMADTSNTSLGSGASNLPPASLEINSETYQESESASVWRLLGSEAEGAISEEERA
jgi:predicted alpha-1,2-mannosidase